MVHRVLPHTRVWKCASVDCSLQFAHPQPSAMELERIYRDLYYPGSRDAKAARFENTSDDILRQVLRQLEERLGRLRGLRLLDYGCGRGALLRVSLEFGLDPIGIEPDSQARAVASQISAAPVYRSLEDLSTSQPDGQFDLITLWTVIEHLRRPWEDVARLRRLLHPGGCMLISTMDVNCLRSRLEKEHWEQYENPTHLYYFDFKSLAHLVRTAGFSDLSQWRPTIRFSHHGLLRRWFYRLNLALGLADGLFCLCQQTDRPEETRKTSDIEVGLAAVIESGDSASS